MRLALLASATWLLSYASPAVAQVPVFQSERAPEPEPDPVAAALPPAPVPPPGATAPPAAAPADAANAPAPAKAAVITDHDAQREARAEPDLGEGDDLDAAHQPRWYGWQTLVADGASFGALILGTALSEQSDAGDTLVGLGLLGYAFVPGIVHFAHRNPGRGFASFGIRLGMPLAGAFLGASLASGCNTNLCEAGGAGVGVLLGMGGAIAIDAAVFAYDDRKRPATRRLGLVPLVSVTPQNAWFGVAGQL